MSASPEIETEFLDLYLSDWEGQRIRPLADYQARFPGHEDVVAKAFEAVQAGDEPPRLENQGSSGAGPSTMERAHQQSSTVWTTIGPYTLVRPLGRGGMGQVWLARQKKPKRDVALKTLLPSVLCDSSIRRFEQEAELLGRLRHPAIAKVYEAGIDEAGQAFIAMEYLQGPSLAQLIQDARTAAEGDSKEPHELHALEFPSTARYSTFERTSDVDKTMKTVAFVEQAARGLHEAHERGVIHRDVKPGNIMVSEDGQPVLLDFGLARAMEDDTPTLTRTGEVFGTPHYMSPEQAAGEHAEVDRRTDVWSLGVTLYECLGLQRPFDGPKEHLHEAIRSSRPKNLRRVNQRVPKDLWIVVATAIEKDKARRYQTALEFAEDLRRVRKRLPILARPAALPTVLLRCVQRHPSVSALVSTLIIGAMVLAALSQITSTPFHLELGEDDYVLDDYGTVLYVRDVQGHEGGETTLMLNGKEHELKVGESAPHSDSIIVEVTDHYPKDKRAKIRVEYSSWLPRAKCLCVAVGKNDVHELTEIPGHPSIEVKHIDADYAERYAKAAMQISVGGTSRMWSAFRSETKEIRVGGHTYRFVLLDLQSDAVTIGVALLQ